ncbi:MAG TPA: hypothetical protein VFD03_12020 [Clostridia bacterium]|nr:hypothetical protein [Clostridia bacterium]
MLIKRKFTKATFIVVIIALIFISPISSNTLGSIFSKSDNASPIYYVATAADTQQNIRKLCEEQDFSYELFLSIYHADGINNRAIQEVEKDLAELTYLRDYWTGKGYRDEDVFDLMIISRDMSIDGCNDYVNENPNYKDNEYLKRVTDYKYYLEQSLDYTRWANQYGSGST